jgi:phenylacetate-CoA ligase
MAAALALRLYHQAPPPVRSLIASARGWQLRRWRYGPETDALVSAALERDTWSAARWRGYQEDRLARLLHDASRDVPFYVEQWRARRARGDRSSVERLEHWPILDKATVRRDAAAFVSTRAGGRRLFADHTSGTTGTALTLWCPQETVRAWYALFEARSRQWYGTTRHDSWAILGGQLVTPQAARQPPFWVWNAPLRQLYMSSYHLAPDLVPHYIEALLKYDVKYLYGYSSSLHALAEGARQSGVQGLRLRVAVTNAEPLFAYQRQAIEQVFGCPVRETYGMAETVAAGGECECGAMHLWPDAGVVEVMSDGVPVPTGTTGDFVCTGLLNPIMPLVRYAVGDRGALAAELRCGCRRTLPVVKTIEGRADDVLYTMDGRPIGRLDPVFKAELPVHEAQIIQEAPNRIRVRYVPAPGFSPAAMASMAERLRERLGPVEVIGEAVDTIPRTASGKFRAVIRAFALDDSVPTTVN